VDCRNVDRMRLLLEIRDTGSIALYKREPTINGNPYVVFFPVSTLNHECVSISMQKVKDTSVMTLSDPHPDPICMRHYPKWCDNALHNAIGLQWGEPWSCRIQLYQSSFSVRRHIDSTNVVMEVNKVRNHDKIGWA
jgi:hypothetical protein